MYTARKAMALTVLFLVLIVITPAAYSQALKNSIQTPPAGALVEEFSFFERLPDGSSGPGQQFEHCGFVSLCLQHLQG